MSVIAIKIVIAILLSIFSFCLLTQKVFIESIASKYKNLFFISSFTLLRVFPFVLVYLVFDFSPTSDVPIFFESAKGALRGGFVYKDFQTVYSPLFPYLISLILPFWNSSKAIVLILILFESLALYITLRVSDQDSKYFKSLFYLSLPTGLIFSVLGGQEDILMWGFIAAILLIFQHPRANVFIIGILVAFSLLFTKFLFILIIPAFIVYFKNWRGFLAGITLIGIISFLILYYFTGLSFLGPLNEANIPRTPNIWSFLHTISNGMTPYGEKIMNWIGLALIESLVIFISFRYRKVQSIKIFVQAVFLQLFVFLMIVQQSSYANYAYAFILPLVFFIDLKKIGEIIFFLGLNFLLVVQPAVWWRNGLPYIQNYGDLMDPIKLIVFMMEIYILAGFFWIMFKVDKKIKTIIAPDFTNS